MPSVLPQWSQWERVATQAVTCCATRGYGRGVRSCFASASVNLPTKVFEALTRLVEDRQLMYGVFLPILCTHDELHLEPHRAILLPG